MSLNSGTRVGAYEIVELLGAGGMGEVYRAKDTKLGRAVALKFLSEAVAGDSDRLARFEREAHVLAALNHTHIAAIYGLEHEAGGQLPFLVMELVEGEDLSRRIARGAIPIDEVVPMATQIAEALEVAHNAGVIHRDLKPANIKVRPDGTVKVLDFGLAKISDSADSSSQSHLSHSPTITSPAQLTGQGIVLGTAAYMSPEQAKGRTVDKRADVWAFGAVLYEMLTGRRCFDGEDVSETLAAILRATPDWSALPVATPPAIRRLIRRCLERDVHMRLSDMAMARIELHEAKTGSPEDALAPTSTVVASRSGASRLLPYVATILLATFTGISVWWLTRPADPSRPQVRLALDLPEDQRFAIFNRGVVAISPDGSRVAYAANQRLYLRAMDQASATPMPGTEARLVQNAPRSPFFSPDGQWVAFHQEGQLKKVSVNGSAPITIGTVPNYIGASWGSDDRILLGGGGSAGILQIAAGGGAAERLITPAEGDRLTQPYALPGGDWILYTINPRGTSLGKLVMQSRATRETRELLNGVEDGRYVPSGHLVFMRANALFAQAFDTATRTTHGQPVPILEGVASATGFSLAQADVSSSGTLVFIGATNRERSLTSSLVHVTRDGRRAVLATVSGLAWFPRYSPDGTRVAFGLSEVSDLNELSDLWVVDVARGARTRVTFAENTRFHPIWSPDGTRLTFANGTGLTNRLQSALADGSGSLESLTDVESRRFPTSWSPDGRTLAFFSGAGAPNFKDLGMLHADADKWTAKPFVGTPFDERGAIFSPNGRWVAYVSNKSGIDDIYARPFPGPGAEVTISVGGGAEPVWGPSGRELFYRRENKLMAVRIEERGGSLVVSSPTLVFDDPYRPDTSGAHGVANYDIAPDGKRFVMVEEPQGMATTQIARIEVILNWLDELRRRVPSP
jgi:serine/threonine protein kinase/Tol biopolymer transport system component